MRTEIVNQANQDKIFCHLLLYKEKKDWIAHCLELDLIADSAEIDQALSRLAGVIQTHISYLRKHKLMDQLYNPAPKKYWRMLAQAESLGEIVLTSRKVRSSSQRRNFPKIPKIPAHEIARLNLEYRQSGSV